MTMLAFHLQPWHAVVAAVLLYGILCIIRRPGKGGALGRAVRQSDWQAWRDAMDAKERELEQLRQAEPRR